MPKTKNQFFQIILIIFAIMSFIYGFNNREDSAGGGKYDFVNTWNNQTTFNENSFITSMRNTKTSEIRTHINSHFPFSYILNKYINPFSNEKKSFLISIFILNFFIPIIFFFCLRNKFRNKNIYLLAFLSSILYLSPYFRTSAYWAGMENYGLMTFLLSFYFFSNYLNNNSKKKLNIILFSIFSCLCVYFDQKLLFVPIFYLLFFFKKENCYKNKILYLILNFLLSIPILLLIFYWGSVTSPHDTVSRNVGNDLYFEQIGYSLSIIFFYLIPYILFNFQDIYKVLKIKISKIFVLSIIFIIYLILINVFPTNYYSWNDLGKGWLHKVSTILFDNSSYGKIFTYIIFYISFILIYIISLKKPLLQYFVLFFSLISLIILPVFQEYFDPLMLIFLSLSYYKENEIKDSFVTFQYLFSSLFLISLNLYY